jgi:MFS transporter, DHA1 family, inner membrane transport protein
VYAVGGPLLAVATGNACRRRVMLAALGIFVLANVLAAVAPDYAVLATARVLAAVGAGMYMPAAAATATVLAEPAERGRALAAVLGGLTIANAVGVPLGTLIGQAVTWRATFALVAALGTIAFGGLRLALGRVPSQGTASLAERAAVARIRGVPASLAVIAASICGVFILYTYLAWFAGRAGGLAGAAVSLIYLLFGVTAVISNFTAGWLADRISPARVAAVSISCLTVLFAALGLTARAAGPSGSGSAAYAIGIGVTLWGLTGWLFYPALQKLLATAAGPRAAIALSLAASSLYAGQAVAGVAGGMLLRHGPASLGLSAAACELLALTILLAASGHLPRPAPVGQARPQDRSGQQSRTPSGVESG